MRSHLLWTLFVLFVPLSFLSVGGGASILAPLQHDTVEVRHWLTQRDFVDLFAISRAAPGPGSMLVTLIGWKLAGWSGALTASLAFFLPSSLLCYGFASLWNRYRHAAWHETVERGLAPIATGLILSGAIAVLRTSGGGVTSWALAGAAAGIFLWRGLHPLIILAAGGCLFMLLRFAGA